MVQDRVACHRQLIVSECCLTDRGAAINKKRLAGDEGRIVRWKLRNITVLVWRRKHFANWRVFRQWLGVFDERPQPQVRSPV
jgi:hypothetical protein